VNIAMPLLSSMLEKDWRHQQAALIVRVGAPAAQRCFTACLTVLISAQALAHISEICNGQLAKIERALTQLVNRRRRDPRVVHATR
jgi:hypothetical protein